jgi:hypothetical protein
MLDGLDPHGLENLRRLVAMPGQYQPSGLTLERALRIISELQRLQRSDRHDVELVGQLRALLDGVGQAGC